MPLSMKCAKMRGFSGELLGKGRLVLSVIRKHVESNPKVTFPELEAAFPKELQGSAGCFDTVENAQRIWDRTGRKRHFLSPGEAIEIADSKIAVCSQWGIDCIGPFIDSARQLGYRIEEVGEYDRASESQQ